MLGQTKFKLSLRHFSSVISILSGRGHVTRVNTSPLTAPLCQRKVAKTRPAFHTSGRRRPALQSESLPVAYRWLSASTALKVLPKESPMTVCHRRWCSLADARDRAKHF